MGRLKIQKGPPECPEATGVEPRTTGTDIHREDGPLSEDSPDSSKHLRLQLNTKRKGPDPLSSAERTAKRPKLPVPTRSNAIRHSCTGNRSLSGETATWSLKLSPESMSGAKGCAGHVYATSRTGGLTVEDSHQAEPVLRNQDIRVVPKSLAEHSSTDSSLEASENSTASLAAQSPFTSSPLSAVESEGVQLPLVIDLASPSSTWRPEDMGRVRHAADFLFSCGLLEDAFPLYVLLWKQLDASTTSTIMRHSVVLSCWRSATTYLHKSIVANILEKELDEDREILSVHYISPTYARSYTCLFHLLRAQITFPQSDPHMVSTILKSVSNEFFTLNALAKSFVELRTNNPRVMGPKRTIREYAKCWIPHSIVPDPIVLSPGTADPVPNSQAKRDQKRVLRHHLPFLLTSAAFFDYDIPGLLEWCREPLSDLVLATAFPSKLRDLFRQHQSRPEIALGCYFWETWQRCEISGPGARDPYQQQYQKRSPWPLRFWIGPRTIGLDGVSVAELLVVTSSLILTEKLSRTKSYFSKDFIEGENFLRVICDNHVKLTELDNETLHENFRKRHLLIIERQRQSPPAESRQALRKTVEECTGIILPDTQPPSPRKQGKMVSMFSSTSRKADADPTLAESLRPSEDSSFRRFASHARRSIAVPFSQSSRRSAILGSKSSAAGSAIKPLSVLTDRLSTSFRALSISDSAQMAILGLNQNQELDDEEPSGKTEWDRLPGLLN